LVLSSGCCPSAVYADAQQTAICASPSRAEYTGAAGIFEGPAKAASADAEARQAELFEQIGRLKMELEWLKKKVAPFG
jgi:hypothetical protein